ncbi:MAG TPA: MFS transporter [Bosea sp. (in: a-proteobacteria)]|jgi:MFS family permease|uniref:MFS transporter n=1 Tax=Bosea sp. (in: a-proteobacteria) TaxID=1871050 RepID=UPI002E160805|nr:MFS transporter [Bosea sp. (in: a-proteobacteria)]
MSEAPTPAPLSNPVFRALWIATVVSNIGTWMHDVGAGWLMTTLSPDPLMVALVQAATTLPMFLLALPGGALADIVDRRKLLIGAQLCGLAATAALAATTFAGLTGPLTLLSLTVAIAAGAALSAPAFQAIVPELVPAAAVPQAVALNSLGVNIARAIGPALGGLIIALSGPAAVFALNAVSFLGILLVLARWQRQPRASRLPAEHFFGALRAGARYASQASALQIVLIRSAGFFLFASALWALLPLIARRELGLGPAGYGGLLTLMGLGAVAGAMLLPRLRDRLSANRMTIVASLLFALSTGGLALAPDFATAGAVLALAGLAWIAMMSALNGAAQASSPAWVKARALAIYLVVFQGAMTLGATLWGTLAARLGIPVTLGMAALGQVLALFALAARHPLGAMSGLDLSPSSHWPAPVVEGTVEADRGPVMVTIEYRVDPARMADFVRAMRPMRRIRRRDGAIGWYLLQDAAAPGIVVESFVLESWLEHLRQHERVTHTDREHQAAAHAFHLGPEPPVVRHLIQPR